MKAIRGLMAALAVLFVLGTGTAQAQTNDWPHEDDFPSYPGGDPAGWPDSSGDCTANCPPPDDCECPPPPPPCECPPPCETCPPGTTTTTRPGGTTSTTKPGGATTTTQPGGGGTTTTQPGGGGTTTSVPGGGGTTTTSVPGGGGTTTSVPGGGGTTTSVPGGGGTTTTQPGVVIQQTTTTGPGRATVPPGSLPRTGAGSAGLLLQVGGGLLVVGLPLVLAEVRKRRADPGDSGDQS